MSSSEPPTLEELDDVSRYVSGNLAAFLGTLRDNAFPVGLAEGQDAAALMAAGFAKTPALLRSAFKHLFSARKADWEKFDGIFDAFFLGRHIRSRSTASGSLNGATNPTLKNIEERTARREGHRAPIDQISSPDQG